MALVMKVASLDPEFSLCRGKISSRCCKLVEERSHDVSSDPDQLEIMRNKP